MRKILLEEDELQNKIKGFLTRKNAQMQVREKNNLLYDNRPERRL